MPSNTGTALWDGVLGRLGVVVSLLLHRSGQRPFVELRAASALRAFDQGHRSDFVTMPCRGRPLDREAGGSLTHHVGNETQGHCVFTPCGIAHRTPNRSR